MSEHPPLPPPPRNTCGFGDPALVFPEFATKQCVLEKVQEVEGEGEDSSYGKGSFDLSSRFSSPSISRNNYFFDVENQRKTPPSLKLPPPYGLKLSGFQEDDEEVDHSINSGSFVDHIDHEEKRECSGFFRKCCACTCVFMSIFLLIALLTGLSVNFSIKSRLPLVYITKLDFSRFDFTNSTTDVLLNANINTVLQLSNVNDKTTLYYSPMKADVSSENINLGQKKILGFAQSPGNVTYLKIVTRLRKYKANDVDATLLRNNVKSLEAEVNVLLSGKVSFDWLGFRIHLSIVIACEDVKQSDVKNGLKPECDVRIFSQ
ncbi:unnamed protein product [Cochlearia groenlandica]